jgi:hypothetical protein
MTVGLHLHLFVIGITRLLVCTNQIRVTVLLLTVITVFLFRGGNTACSTSRA